MPALPAERAKSSVAPLWAALAGTLVGAAISGLSTYAAADLSARAQLKAHADASHAREIADREAERRRRRAEVYAHLLDAARGVSEAALRVYQECPDDLTTNGCHGDTALVDNAMDSFLDAYEDVMSWGTPQAAAQAKVLLSKLPQARPGCSTRNIPTDGSMIVEIPPAISALPDPGNPHPMPSTFTIYHVVCPDGPQYGRPTTVHTSVLDVRQAGVRARPVRGSLSVRFTLKKPPDVGAFESAYESFRAVMRCEVAVESSGSC